MLLRHSILRRRSLSHKNTGVRSREVRKATPFGGRPYFFRNLAFRASFHVVRLSWVERLWPRFGAAASVYPLL